jgi:hypothetical protein
MSVPGTYPARHGTCVVLNPTEIEAIGVPLWLIYRLVAGPRRGRDRPERE